LRRPFFLKESNSRSRRTLLGGACGDKTRILIVVSKDELWEGGRKRPIIIHIGHMGDICRLKVRRKGKDRPVAGEEMLDMDSVYTAFYFMGNPLGRHYFLPCRIYRA